MQKFPTWKLANVVRLDVFKKTVITKLHPCFGKPRDIWKFYKYLAVELLYSIFGRYSGSDPLCLLIGLASVSL